MRIFTDIKVLYVIIILIIKLLYENNTKNPVADLLKQIINQPEIHGKFIIVMLEQLKLISLEQLTREDTELTIETDNGHVRTRKYRLVKLLRKKSIYKLRYGLSANCHLRLLFFPFYYKGNDYYMFTHAIIKTLRPPFDPTNILRDESQNAYVH